MVKTVNNAFESSGNFDNTPDCVNYCKCHAYDDGSTSDL